MSEPTSHVDQSGINHYIFTSTWPVPADVDQVFKVLSDVVDYTAWWPEFKSATRTGPDTGDFVLRSFLPFSLRFSLQREIEDREHGHLRARASGDIAGTVQWLVRSERSNFTRADFRQDVILMHPFARRLSPVLKPLLRLNHTAAMRGGYAGLRRHLHL